MGIGDPGSHSQCHRQWFPARRRLPGARSGSHSTCGERVSDTPGRAVDTWRGEAARYRRVGEAARRMRLRMRRIVPTPRRQMRARVTEPGYTSGCLR